MWNAFCTNCANFSREKCERPSNNTNDGNVKMEFGRIQLSTSNKLIIYFMVKTSIMPSFKLVIFNFLPRTLPKWLNDLGTFPLQHDRKRKTFLLRRSVSIAKAWIIWKTKLNYWIELLSTKFVIERMFGTHLISEMELESDWISRMEVHPLRECDSFALNAARYVLMRCHSEWHNDLNIIIRFDVLSSCIHSLTRWMSAGGPMK